MITWWLEGIDPAYVPETKTETKYEDINKNSFISVRESRTKHPDGEENISESNQQSPVEDKTQAKNLKNGRIPSPAMYIRPQSNMKHYNDKTSESTDAKRVKVGKVIEFIDDPTTECSFTPVEIPDTGRDVDGKTSSSCPSRHSLDSTDT